MSNQTVNKEKKFIGVKDLILGVLLGLLSYVLASIPMLFLQPLGLEAASILSVAIAALISGTIYVLIIRKSPRIGSCFVFTIPFAIVYLIMGTVAAPILLLIAGIVGELSMLSGGYESKWRGVIPFCLFWLAFSFGSLSSMIFMPEASIQTFISAGMEETAARAMLDATIAIYTAPTYVILQIVAAIGGSVIGYFIGTKVLHKRFKGAGVA